MKYRLTVLPRQKVGPRPPPGPHSRTEHERRALLRMLYKPRQTSRSHRSEEDLCTSSDASPVSGVSAPQP
jgi:hypothetical protein